MKRLELNEEERGIISEALRHWRRKYSGRAGYAKAKQVDQEWQAQYVERKEKEKGLEPKLGEVYRRPIAGWQAEEARHRSLADATKALLARIEEPDDPMQSFVSQECLAAVKGGQCAVLRDEKDEEAAALVPIPLYRLVKAVVGHLRGWCGPWTIVKLSPSDVGEEAAEDRKEAGVG